MSDSQASSDIEYSISPQSDLESAPSDGSLRPRGEPTFWPMVLPFALFMLLTLAEPKVAESTGENDSGLARQYLLIYSAKIALVLGLFIAFAKVYWRHFPWRLSAWAVPVGLAGGVLWIGLCELGIERQIGSWIGLPSGWFETRSGINPGDQYAGGWTLGLFYAIRFTGLVVAVPLAEEIFLRGFLVRYLEDTRWWKVQFNQLSAFPLAAASLYGVLTHPLGEALAAALWFGLLTLLIYHTRSLWDCVVAHAVTNLMLGIYVVTNARWYLW